MRRRFGCAALWSSGVACVGRETQSPAGSATDTGLAPAKVYALSVPMRRPLCHRPRVQLIPLQCRRTTPPAHLAFEFVGDASGFSFAAQCALAPVLRERDEMLISNVGDLGHEIG